MKTIIVTGGTRGIGYSICESLLSAGYKVIATGRDPDNAIDLIDSTNIVYEKLDLNDASSIIDFCLLMEHVDDLAGLVNNAGINIIESYADISENHFDEIINVNLRSCFKLSQACIKALNKRGSAGRIVHIGSIWSVISKAGRASYSASKSALQGLTHGMSAELSSQGILVNMVSPGFVKTELTANSLSDEEIQALCEQIPMKRMAEPSEIAELVSFLISDRNTYITGQNIVIDGGFSHV